MAKQLHPSLTLPSAMQMSDAVVQSKHATTGLFTLLYLAIQWTSLGLAVARSTVLA